MHVIEVEDDIMIKTCEIHDYKYTIITKNDLVIPPERSMILFEKVRWKNFLSTGNQNTEINLTKHPTNLIIGTNGAGKEYIT